MALNIGRQGKLFVKKEAAYGTNPGFAAGDAVRHIDIGFQFDPFNRVNSNEKKQSPGQVVFFDRKKSAAFEGRKFILRPSGTLNTLPEADEILLCGFGSQSNVTASTTVASGGGVGGATLTSSVGFVVGDAISIVLNGLKYVRFLLTNDTGTGAVTWAPNLPGSPANGAAVKSGNTYKLTTDLALSLSIGHYLAGMTRELNGVAIDKLSFMFDANEEPMFSASGPAALQITPASAQPGSFTTVGGNPPSGLVGECLIGNTAYLIKKSQAEITNNVRLRNQEYGVNTTTEAYRAGRRTNSISLEAFAETEATLYDLAEAGTRASFFKQTGRTEGNIVAIYAQSVDWKVPDQDDPDEEVNWSFKGIAAESADGSNDEIKLAFL